MLSHCYKRQQPLLEDKKERKKLENIQFFGLQLHLKAVYLFGLRNHLV